MNKPESPEAFAVVPLTAATRRPREILLAQMMLVAIDIILSGEPLGMGVARDLAREVWHCYPELSEHWDEL